jgi:hypothetical protein
MTEAGTSAEEPASETEALPAFLADNENGDADPEESQPDAVAAE